MKYKDINQKFSNLVYGFLMSGYCINSQSMGGTQGEICKVDLVKDNELLRVWVTGSVSSKSTGYIGNILVLSVGKWIYGADESTKRTVWMRDLVTIYQETYYDVSSNSYKESWYTDDLEYALKCQALRYERYRRDEDDPTPRSHHYKDEVRKGVATEYLKRKQGYKRVSSKDTTVVSVTYTESKEYYVRYRENYFKLQ